MKSGNILLSLFFMLAVAGCGGGGSSSSTSANTTTASTTSPTSSISTTTTSVQAAINVLPITVNGAVCNAYQNEPCVDVTVCTPGTSNCQTISGILLDTSSFGLRIFKQALNVPLKQVSTASGSLAECVTFADNTTKWGPVQTAGVILGNEPAVQVPVQVIDYSFSSEGAAVCYNAEKSPSDAGFNGILGIGAFIQDCGSTCASSAVGEYYSCNGATCLGTTVSTNNQVQNPVPFLPADNNGVIIQLPAVPAAGSVSLSGSVILGIGTQANNSPSGVTAYPLNSVGEFNTEFNNVLYSGSFIDTGSNGLFFPSPYNASSGPYAGLLQNCTGTSNPYWFCPTSTTSLSAVIFGAATNAIGTTLPFQIGNFESLTASSSNRVFNDIGGSPNAGGNVFDWGLPFFLGRSVYIGIYGKSSSLGNGPYFAY